MKKLVLCGAIAVLSSSAIADIMDARAMARGGTGAALGDDFRSVAKNPALLVNNREEDNYAGALSFGVMASDRDGIADDIEDAGDALDDFEDNQTQQNADAFIAAAKVMDQKGIRVDAGANISVALPFKAMPVALTINNMTAIGATFVYDSADEAYLDQVVLGAQSYDEDQLQSRLDASGYMINEVAFSYANPMDTGDGFLGVINTGVAIKYQDITVIEERVLVNYDSDDLSENEDDYSTFNMDVGFHKTWLENDRLHTGLTLKNILPKDFKGAMGGTLRSRPQLTVGAAYDAGWNRSSIDLDIGESWSLGKQVQGSQFLRFGTEMRLGKHAQLRLGVRHDLADGVDDIATVGIGLSPFGLFNLDITAMAGESDTAGVALQLGMAF